MKAFKGFDKDLKCQGFQYEIGKEYKEEKASLCNNGFHACEYPLDCFRYYEPNKSRYCVVEIDDNGQREDCDTKVCGTHIKIGAEIGIPGLVKAAVEYVSEKAVPSNRHHTTKKLSANSATGNRSAISATGYGSANLSTGYECSNEGNGERNICIGGAKITNAKVRLVASSFFPSRENGTVNSILLFQQKWLRLMVKQLRKIHTICS